MEVRRGHCIRWNWRYGSLWATIWVLGTESRSFARATNALNHWARSPFWLQHGVKLHIIHYMKTELKQVWFTPICLTRLKSDLRKSWESIYNSYFGYCYNKIPGQRDLRKICLAHSLREQSILRELMVAETQGSCLSPAQQDKCLCPTLPPSAWDLRPHLPFFPVSSRRLETPPQTYQRPLFTGNSKPHQINNHA